MRKRTKRLLALVLVLTMMVSFAVPAFAESSEKPEYGFYFPIGTSVTVGYGMTTGWGGTGKDRMGFANGSYPQLVAQYFGIPNGTQGALEGMRAAEVRIILEPDFHGDDYTEEWMKRFISIDEAGLKLKHDDYVENIGKADLITIEIGCNEMMSTVMQKAIHFIDENLDGNIFGISTGGGGGFPTDPGGGFPFFQNDAVTPDASGNAFEAEAESAAPAADAAEPVLLAEATENTELSLDAEESALLAEATENTELSLDAEESALLAEENAEPTVGGLTEASIREYLAEPEPGSTDYLAGLIAIADQIGIYADMVNYLITSLNTSMADYKVNFDAMLDDILGINPDVELVVVGCFNPIKYVLEHETSEQTIAAVRQIALSAGEILNISTETLANFSEMVSTPMVDAQNAYMMFGSRHVRDYVYTDVTNVVLDGSLDGTHPSYVGHAYIAEHVESAILSRYECRHIHKTTVGAYPATAFTLGYSGTVYCSDCGKRLDSGHILVYSATCKHNNVELVDAAEPTESFDGYTGDRVCADCGKLIEQGKVLPKLKPGQGSDEPGEIVYPERDCSVLAFSSDVHNMSNNTSANRLASWLVSAQQNEGAFEYMGFCGDLADGSNSGMRDTEYWRLASKVFETMEAAGIETGYTTGNHEQQQGKYTTTTELAKDKVKRLQEIKSADNYRVYAFGAADSYQTFPDADIAVLESYMKTVPSNIPVFILSHYPLHDNQGGRNMTNEESVIKVLNNYPNAIFIWGHNHTDASSSEKHYDRVYTGMLDSTPINFTYAAAGCMSDSEYPGGGSGSVRAKGMVVTVSHDDTPTVTITYLNANGVAIDGTVEIDITGNSAPIEKPYSFGKVKEPENRGQYIIVANNDIALDLSYSSGYVNGTNYAYSGFKGKAVNIDGDAVVGGANKDMVWEFREKEGGFTIKNVATGKYLNAVYSGSGDNLGGYIKCDEVSDVWSWNKGENTMQTKNGSNKYLAYEQIDDINGGYETATVRDIDFFSIRSDGNKDSVTLYKVGMGSEQEEEPQESGVPAISEEPYSFKVSAPEAGKNYLIVYNNSGNMVAMDTTVCSGYVNRYNYSYSGLKGKSVSLDDNAVTGNVYADMVWSFEQYGNGFTIKNAYTGKTLSATYTNNSSNAKDGVLKLDKVGDKWTLNGSQLVSATAGKTLAFDLDGDIDKPYTGECDFFTVRSKGDNLSFYEVDVPVPAQELQNFQLDEAPAAGNKYILTVDGNAFDTTKGNGFGSRTVSEADEFVSGYLFKDMVWELVDAQADDGSVYLVNRTITDKYLSNADGSLAFNGYSGPENTWKLQNGKLLSYGGKYLAFDAESKAFTLSDKGSAPAVNFYLVKDESKLLTPGEPIPGNLERADKVESGMSYILCANGYALDTVFHEGYLNTDGYAYSGFEGTAVKTSAGKLRGDLSTDMVFAFTKSGNGYTIMHVDSGRYLASTYEKNSTGGSSTGELFLSKDPDVWDLSNGKLHSARSDKFLTYDVTAESKLRSGSSSLFTVRSVGNAGTLSFYKVTDMSALSDPDDDPVELTDRARMEKPIDGKTFVIMSEGYALTAAGNKSLTLSSGGKVSGLNGKRVSVASSMLTGAVTDNMLWVFNKDTGSRFTIQSYATGEYLVGTTEDADTTLALSDQPDIWAVRNGRLTSTSSGKSLCFESANTVAGDYTGNINFFGIGSGSTPVSFYFIEKPEEVPKAPYDPADYMSDCFRTQIAAMGKGSFRIVLGSRAIGVRDGMLVTEAAADVAKLGNEFLWSIEAAYDAWDKPVEGGWFIRNTASELYLNVYVDSRLTGSDISAALGTQPYAWFYDGALYSSFENKAIFGLKHDSTYYLCCSGETVSMNRRAVSGNVKLYKTVPCAHSIVAEVISGSCTEAGTIVYRCENCGQSCDRVSTEAPGHSYVSTVIKPSCTEDGCTVHTCTVCGDSYRDGIVDKLGHRDADEDLFCDRCGEYMAPALSVTTAFTRTTTTKRVLLIKRTVTEYAVSISTSIPSAKIEYATDLIGLIWKTGDGFTSSIDPGSVLIRITEPNGTRTTWRANSSTGETVKVR